MLLLSHACEWQCRLQDGATDKEAQDLATALHAGTKQLAGLLNQSVGKSPVSCFCGTAVLHSDIAATCEPLLLLQHDKEAKVCQSFRRCTVCPR